MRNISAPLLFISFLVTTGCVGDESAPIPQSDICIDALDEVAAAWCWQGLECGEPYSEDVGGYVDECIAIRIARGKCVGTDADVQEQMNSCLDVVIGAPCDNLLQPYPPECEDLLQ